MKGDMKFCECAYWARTDGLITTHNPNCPRFREGIIDIWKVTVDGKSCYCDKEQDAIDINGDLEGVIIKVKMHRELYEHLPEFDGF